MAAKWFNYLDTNSRIGCIHFFGIFLYYYPFDHCALEISRTELTSGGSQDQQQLADRNDKGNHTKYEHWYQGPSSLLRVAFQTHVSKQGDFFMDLVISPYFPFPFFFFPYLTICYLRRTSSIKKDDWILHGLITLLEFMLTGSSLF